MKNLKGFNKVNKQKLLQAMEPYWIYDYDVAQKLDPRGERLKELANQLKIIQLRIKSLEGKELKDQAIMSGMITSNEPALYRQGKYGIRHENLILCKEAEKSEFGDFLKFETLTLCHFETSGIIADTLTNEERYWLNNYHQKVYDTLSPELDEKHKAWLKDKTKAI